MTFTGLTTTVDHATGGSTVSVTTVPGYAIATPGSEKLYEALKLIGAAAVTLLLAPDAGYSLPTLGMTVAWDGTTYTVKHTKGIAPGGTLLLGRVVVAA
ncbi:MAG TPA: hypothetical protein VNA25_11280 [Phycisphaerae bacterium]|nr:hypothetical protein [Phycisphaerae bacterium]